MLSILLASLVSVPTTQANPKYASIVVDAQTGKILRARNMNKRLHPASLTKMMTLYLTFEALERGKLRPTQRLYVSRQAQKQPPSELGLKRGQYITVRDAIRALVTKSANDVAVVLAEAIAGTEWDFGRVMTKRARSLGMSRTTFQNASGLYHRAQLSTARDMALLARALMMHYPGYYHLFSTQEFTYQGRTYRNHNRLMRSYQGMDGLKTGYIRAAGFNLAASATRSGKRLIGVVFGGRTTKTRNRHMRAILDETFARMRRQDVQVAYFNPEKIKPPIPDRKPGAIAQQAVTQVATVSSAQGAFAAKLPLPKPKPDSIYAKAIEATGMVPPTPPRQPKPQVAIGNTGIGKYGIQVGAFDSRAASDAAIMRVREKLRGRLPQTAQPVIVPLKTRRGSLMYRARLVNLDSNTAHDACRHLNDCLVMALR